MCVDLATILDSMISQTEWGTTAKFSCTSCGKQLADRRDMRRHCETHLDIKHECEICGKRCKTSNALRMHRSNYHK